MKATYLDALANLSQNNEEVQNFIYANSDFIENFIKTVVDSDLASVSVLTISIKLREVS